MLDEDNPAKEAEVEQMLKELDGELQSSGRGALAGEETAIVPDMAHWKARASSM